jgi:glycosyltransferase involved in cell wall biosynthesis
MKKISATLITFNEEDNIREALESLKWVDEIVVVDAHSQDKTVHIARQYTDKIFVQTWKGYVEQKNYAIKKASFDWILSLDADERVTDELREEIERLRTTGVACDGYFVPRKTFYLGRWIKHCGWYPNYQLRLFRKSKACWIGGSVHERCKVDGVTCYLKNPLLHYTYKNIFDHIERMNLYSSLSAHDRISSGKKTNLIDILGAPIAAFVKTYFIKLGLLDGIPGLIISTIISHYAFLKRIKVWEQSAKNGEK